MENYERKENSNNTSWSDIEKVYATEIIASEAHVSKAKNFAIGCMAAALVAISLGMALINYNNDKDWREFFSSYDFVSQDGSGVNNINTGSQGDLNNREVE